MKLRKLQEKDAPLMLEWMHDDGVVHNLKQNFAQKTIDDCIRFIREAQDESKSIHLAIANDTDEYMGTVSLKNIKHFTAEFGIVLRSCAIGHGYAGIAMNEIIKYGFQTGRINTVYWCVNPENKRAIHFYEKYSFQRCDVPEQALEYTVDEKRRYIWYRVERRMTGDEESI